MNIIRFLWNRLAALPVVGRIVMKWIIFIVVVVGVLFPNPFIFVEQIQNMLDMERLIQPDFKGIDDINREIDQLLDGETTRGEEFRLIQRYVYRHIPYSYDWHQWGVVDYWPVAEKVWESRTEDCDGRAVLAVSILRSRGFESAHLVASLRHMWVAVDDVELMGPDSEKSIKKEDGRTVISLPSITMFLKGYAFKLGEFPATRSAVILLTLLVLLYHPCRNLTGLLGTMLVGLSGFIMLLEWGRKFVWEEELLFDFNFILGNVLIGVAILTAVGMARRALTEIK